jgi:hypothetical protein
MVFALGKPANWAENITKDFVKKFFLIIYVVFGMTRKLYSIVIIHKY